MTDNDAISRSNNAAIIGALCAIVQSLRASNAVDMREVRNNMKAVIKANKMRNDAQAVVILEMLLEGFELDGIRTSNPAPYLSLVTEQPDEDIEPQTPA